MTGSWRIEINGKRIDEDDSEYGECLKGEAEYGHMEGISVSYVIDKILWKLKTGDKLTLICELEE